MSQNAMPKVTLKGESEGATPVEQQPVRRSSRGTRRMSERRQRSLFGEFWQWGLDERGWRKGTRTMRMRIAMQADRWLMENRQTPLIFAEEKDLRAYLFQLRGKTGEPNAWTRNAYTSAIQRFFEFLIQQGYRRDNPAAKLKHLPAPKEIPKAFSGKDAEKIAIAAHLSERHYAEAMVLLTLLEGLRRNEIRLLEWQRVNFHERLIEVNEGAKGGRGRVVPMHPLVYDVLTQWRHESFGRWVFESDKRPGYPWSATHIGKVFTEVGVAAGLHLHAHLGRHTFATHVLFLDGNLRTVQKLLGHASPNTTARYTDARPSIEGARAVRKLQFRKAKERG